MRTTAPSAAGPQASPEQIIRFAIVGSASTLLYLVLTIALERAGVVLAAASIAAYLASAALSFLGQDRKSVV